MGQYNSIVQDGRYGRPDTMEAECTKCDSKFMTTIMEPTSSALSSAQRLLVKLMVEHAEETGHIVIQVGVVAVPIPKGQNIVRRIR
jgi:hypothetical protein